MTLKTVLNDSHRALGARMVDFGGWDMPVQYTSLVEEHEAVRNDAGMFDVSHMTVVDLHGPRTRDFLRHLLANNVDKLKVKGKALYTAMLNPQGGIIDDLIVYFLDDEFFRLVVNASTREKDLEWINGQAADFGVTVTERPEFGMIAVQGPNAREKMIGLLEASDHEAVRKLGKFAARNAKLAGGTEVFVARTGYTGEDGFEIIVPEADTVALWDALLGAGVKPAGLGARDTLRLEAGMNLYGSDMDETVNPYEAGMGWTVSLDEGRPFVGRDVLETVARDGSKRQIIGLVMDEKGVLRHGQVVYTDQGEGEILSGTFAPTLKKGIALARVPAGEVGDVSVDIRGRKVPVRVVNYPFVRDGKAQQGVLTD